MPQNPHLNLQFYAQAPQDFIHHLADFRAQRRLKYLAIGKHQWQYDIHNPHSNEALLLLHGGGGDAEALFPYMIGFAQHFQVIAPNIPHTIKTVDDAVQGLRAVLAQERISQIHLVGFSFGAMLAQMVIRRLPDSVMRMVITHTVIPSDHLREQINMQRALIGFYPAPLLLWMMKRAYRRNIQRSRTPASAGARLFWQAYFDELYSTRFRKRDLLSRARISADYHSGSKFRAGDLSGWQGEMLIIESSEDEIISEGDRGALKGMYPHSYVQILWGYDHLAPLLAADELSSSITKFLLK